MSYHPLARVLIHYVALQIGCAFALSFFSFPVFAMGVGETTQVGSSEFVQTLSIDGGFQRKPLKKDERAKSPWRWGLNFSDTKTIDTSQSPPIIDETQEANGAVGWSGEKWSSEVGLIQSATPDENLTSSGITLRIGYEFDFKPPPAKISENGALHEEDSEEDEGAYEPWARLGFILGRRNYIEYFNGSTSSVVKKKTVTKPLTGSNSIDQETLGMSVRWAPSDKWTFGADFSYYLYSSDLADFEQLLNSPRALQDGFSSLGGSVGSLSLSSSFFMASYDLSDLSSIDFSENYSILAVDLSNSFATRLTIGREFFKALRVAIGIEYDSSDISYDTSGILSLNGHF